MHLRAKVDCGSVSISGFLIIDDNGDNGINGADIAEKDDCANEEDDGVNGGDNGEMTLLIGTIVELLALSQMQTQHFIRSENSPNFG